MTSYPDLLVGAIPRSHTVSGHWWIPTCSPQRPPAPTRHSPLHALNKGTSGSSLSWVWRAVVKETTGPAFKAFPFCGDGGLSPGRHSRESAVRRKRCAEGVQEGPAGGCSEGPGPLSDSSPRQDQGLPLGQDWSEIVSVAQARTWALKLVQCQPAFAESTAILYHQRDCSPRF